MYADDFIAKHIFFSGHFDEVPASQNVVSGQVAEFMCSHPSADTIRWKVNGSLVSLRSRPVGVSIPFDQNDHILTILGVFEYNSTSVQCIAQFDSGASDQVTTLVFLQGTRDSNHIHMIRLCIQYCACMYNIM